MANNGRINVFIFKCLEGDNQYEKMKLFKKQDVMETYINEFLENKFSEGWKRDDESGEYVFGNSEKYAVMHLDKKVH